MGYVNMERFYSTSDMLNQYIEKGWTKPPVSRGYCLNPSCDLASGYINVWGDTETLFFMDADITFHTDLMERYYYTERVFQITFIEDMTVTYYQNKSQANSAKFGIYCHVGNRPRPWYKRFHAGTTQKGSTIAINERFLAKAGLGISDETWDRVAMVINHGDVSLPSLAQICHDIKHSPVMDECFPLYFHAKAVEAVSLLLNYAFSKHLRKLASVSPKSLAAAKEVISILNQSYATPPVIETLAQTVGVDKKTLQGAVQYLTGQTINEYVRSIRMEKALTLLAEDRLRIDEIATVVGYLSKMNFYKAFANTFGCTPREMRKI